MREKMPTYVLFGPRVSAASKQALLTQMGAEEIPADFGPFESGATHCELFPFPKAEREDKTAEELATRFAEKTAQLAGAHVVVVQSTGEQPSMDRSLEQLRSAISTLKHFSAQHITLAMPNTAYDRQDRDFGEQGQLCSVNAQFFAQEMRMRGVDDVITFTPHSQATIGFWQNALGDAHYHVLDATPLFVADMQARFGEHAAQVIIGAPDGADKPNDQGQARAHALATALHGATTEAEPAHMFGIIKRHVEKEGKDTTESHFAWGNVAGQDCAIVDDMSDGGSTLVNAARILKQRGARSVTCYATHAVCTEKTVAEKDGTSSVKSGLVALLKEENGAPLIDHVVLTDSVPEIVQKVASLSPEQQARVSVLPVGALLAEKINNIAAEVSTQDRMPAGSNPALMQEKLALPNWSTLTSPQVRTDKTGTMGAFGIYYGFGEGMVAAARRHKQDPLVAIVERGEKGPNGEARYGLLGGYMDLGSNKTAGEQPAEGAAREAKEEVVDADGKPVIVPNPEQFKPLHAQVSYRNPALPTGNFGFSVELSAEQLSALQTHADKLANDKAYREASIAATHGETLGLRMMPLSKALKLGKEQFTHTHEFDALEKFSAQLHQTRGQFTCI